MRYPTEVKLPNKSLEVTPEVQKVAEAAVRVEALTQPPAEPATYNPNVPRPQSTMYCKEWGSQISSKAETCPKCGVRAAETPGSNRKNIISAGLLAFVSRRARSSQVLPRKNGNGSTLSGILLTVIPSVIGFIEAIQLFSLSEAEFSRK